ncbi:glycosyltransferase family 2 protein [Butyrivibrio sp. MC2013]|uniref:glycosyltransferase family 2 protein n=1 Tax=Butyrivibrio sp. MC2013 TaxID=1280686 RepID=UPI000684F698|nr:glycosyltransferase family 2 protein [Butyrivibrio sp. MC2013]
MIDKDEMLVSVIVPVYKVEKYLEKCIDSILSQSYKKLEIILVDDGSPDKSGVICDKYSKIDNRIKVIHKENGGLSDARNVGIEHSTGDVLSFIDSDDCVSDKFVECLLGAMITTGADIASTDYNIIRFKDDQEDKICFDETYDGSNVDLVNAHTALELLLYQRIPNGAPFRLYNRNIFHNIRFPKGILFEDAAIMYKVFIGAKKIAVVHDKIYAYRVRCDGIIRSQFSDKKMVVIPMTKQLYIDVINYDINLKQAASSRAFSQNYHVLLQVPNEDKESQKKLFKEIKKYRLNVLFDPNDKVRIKNRIGAFVSLFGLRISVFVGKTIKKIYDQ